MLKIEIKNIEELAKEKSLMVSVASRVAPNLVRTAVENAVALKLRAQLKKMGIEADIRVESGS